MRKVTAQHPLETGICFAEGTGIREQGTGIVATAISAENIEIESAAAALPVPCSLLPVPSPVVLTNFNLGV